ncbi:MAG: DinB family protein [Lewinellaceae bacterium]|nr:DinB family protein [Lewinella sp.]MCB9278813.1 DinB family protein [Lewinellaceae bacterium]
MISGSAKEIDRLDQALAALFVELSAYSDEQLNQRPAPGKWSPLMILHHLRLSEHYSHLYVTKKLKGDGPFANGKISDPFRLFLIWFVFNSGIKWKAPPGIGDGSLPETSSLQAVQTQWLAQRQQLREYLSALPDKLSGRAIYKHPYAGRLTLPGMVRFFGIHFTHHRKQVRRALERRI